MQMLTDAVTLIKEKKTDVLYIKISPAEKARIERNMALVGIKNISAFVRRMCLDDGIFKVDLPKIQEVSRLMSITANNVNQLTKRVNGGGKRLREQGVNLKSLAIIEKATADGNIRFRA